MTATLPTQSRNVRPADIGRGVAAALALLVFVAGTPVALVALAPIYLPAAERTWDRVGDLLTSPDDGSLLLAVLGATAWVAWFLFSASVVVELVAGARRAVAPRLPLIGGVQNAAARLVATAGVLLAVSSGLVAHAQPAHATTAVMLERPTSTPPEAPDLGAEPPAPQPVAAPQPADALPHVTVQRGDTLWSIAEHHLGAGTRYTEIRDLNVDRPQPDGGSLIEADWIMPGWQLLLPADATGTEQTSASAAAAPSNASTVTVRPGETLWEIAAEHLGAGDRYVEIADLNRDQVQPDGDALRDPDLIQPGWELLLPTDGVPTSPTEEGSAPAELSTGSMAATDQQAFAPSSPDRSERSTGAEAPATIATTESRAAAPEAASRAEDPDDETDQDEPPTDSRATWFLGLTALGAVGLIGELTRRRHLQQRARRLGESIPMPDLTSPAAHAERTLRSASTPVSIGAITTTLDNLGCRCFDAGRELPRLGVLLLDEHTLTMVLLEDDTEPIAPFTATAPRTWVASTADIAAETAIDDPDKCAPYPLLVTLGHTEHATLIVNLEAAGTLTITGDDTIADDVLRALVIEAATSELSGQLCVCLDPTDDLAPIASAFEPHRLRLTRTDDERSTATTAVAQQLNAQGLGDTLQARGDRQAPDTWLPVTFIERAKAGAGCAAWTGAALVSRHATGDRTGWTIEADERGDAVLRPLGIAFHPQRLRRDQLVDLQVLLDTAVPPTPSIASPNLRPSSAEELVALAEGHGEASDAPTEERRITIRVLGPIEIDGLPSAGTLSSRMTELLVYLALHGPTTGADLDDVLWSGARISAGTRNALIYRTRRNVGTAVLPLADKDGRYRLGDGATTDWHEFQRLLAGSPPGDERPDVDHLHDALELVRDRPFRGISGAQYAWADYDIQRMTGAIADAAAVLAHLQHDAGHHREALDTALHGMQVAPYSESLQGLALDAALATGGADEAARLRARFSALLGELDPELSG